MIEAIKSVVDDLDLSESEKESVKCLFDKIHKAFEALKPKTVSKDSDSDSTKETD